MKRLLSIILYLLASFSAATAQEVKVSAAFDSSRIFVGDQINFTVTVDKPVSYLLTIPVFRDSLMKNLEILKGPSTDTSFLKDGRMRIRHQYLVTSFDSGFYQLMPVYAEMAAEKGIKRYYSDYSQLKVIRVEITPSDTTARFYDIIAPFKAPITAGEVLPWVFLFLILCILIWYLVKIIKKRKMNKSVDFIETDPDPAHIIAFRQLEQLKSEKLWERGEIKEYYTRLTEIVRFYLENRYKINSLEITTVETLAELVRIGLREDDTYRKLRTVLTGADLVKFAKYNPEPSENELHFSYAWDFVDTTKLENEGN
jgi:hypothetical protein